MPGKLILTIIFGLITFIIANSLAQKYNLDKGVQNAIAYTLIYFFASMYTFFTDETKKSKFIVLDFLLSLFLILFISFLFYKSFLFLGMQNQNIYIRLLLCAVFWAVYFFLKILITFVWTSGLRLLGK
jgi:hypothetical protein